MPYFVHPPDATGDDLTSGFRFSTRAEAIDYRDASGPALASHTIAYLTNYQDEDVWHARERRAFRDYTYLALPWCQCTVELDEDRRWVIDDGARLVDGGENEGKAPLYAHLSIKHPGQVAFTKSNEHGHLNRQTTTRPGRFLETYYPGFLTIPERDRFIAACITSTQPQRLSITCDPADIRRIFMKIKNGWSSCMQAKNPSQYDWQPNFAAQRIPCHPCEVYGGPGADLAIAYLGDMDDVKARAVVWPEKKLYYGVVYGDGALLEAALREAGYVTGSLVGARIRLVHGVNGTIVMPYIDGVSRASIEDGVIVLGSGGVETHSTTGMVDCPEDEDEDEPEETFSCDHCENEIDADDHANYSGYCEDCCNARYCCENCDDEYFEDGTATNEGTLCADCATDATRECAIDACGEEWIEATLSRRVQRDRAVRGVELLCESCGDAHAICTACDTYYAIGLPVCPTCTPVTPSASNEIPA